MLPEWFTTKIRRITGTVVAQTLGRTPLSATDLTIAGLVLIAGGSLLVASGRLFWAGLLIAVASSFDMLDGALARAKNATSRIGAFLDSTLDRYAEACIFIGLAVYYQRTAPGSSELLLVCLALVGSLLISYARARAEALGFDCKVGLLERPERIVLLVLGMLTGWMTMMLWALAILTHVTVAQRIYHVWRQGRGEQAPRRVLAFPHRTKD